MPLKTENVPVCREWIQSFFTQQDRVYLHLKGPELFLVLQYVSGCVACVVCGPHSPQSRCPLDVPASRDLCASVTTPASAWRIATNYTNKSMPELFLL